MTAPPKIAVVGTLNVDRVWRVSILPRSGQTIRVSSTAVAFGGKGANQAVAAARLGGDVSIIGALGADADGLAYRVHLQNEGINVDDLLSLPEISSGTAHVYVDDFGENLIVVDSGANRFLAADHVTHALGTIRNSLGAILVQFEGELSATLHALRYACQNGVPAFLNASPVLAGFPWNEVPIDTVIVNEHECREFFHCAPADMTDSSSGILGEFGMNRLVITQGSRETLCLSAEGLSHHAVFSVKPRDTVGAGDTFAGALAVGRARGLSLSESITRANAAAALSTLALGAQTAMPSASAVDTFLKEWRS